MSTAITARDFVGAVGAVDLDVLRDHHVDLATIAAELARDADMDWPWTPDDPTVALLRALARIAIVAPDATSHGATALRDRIGSTHRGRGQQRIASPVGASA